MPHTTPETSHPLSPPTLEELQKRGGPFYFTGIPETHPPSAYLHQLALAVSSPEKVKEAPLLKKLLSLLAQRLAFLEIQNLSASPPTLPSDFTPPWEDKKAAEEFPYFLDPYHHPEKLHRRSYPNLTLAEFLDDILQALLGPHPITHTAQRVFQDPATLQQRLQLLRQQPEYSQIYQKLTGSPPAA